MLSFGVGLALVVGGFLVYEMGGLLAAPYSDNTSVISLAAAQAISKSSGLPDSVITILPYIGIGLMAIGVILFWILQLALYLTKPQHKEY